MRLPKKWSDWEIIEEIGEGSYGKVYEIYREETEESAVVKVVRIPEGSADVFLNEVRLLKELGGGDHILKVLDDHLENNYLYIMMPLLDNLVNYVIYHKMEEPAVVQLGLDLCDALSACDRAGILHRDIKPDNIMFDGEDWLLGDFGFATSDSEDHSMKGTPTYMAPEVYHKKDYGHPSDVYSLGLVLYVFMNRKRDPFMDLNTSIPSYQDREAAMKRRLAGEKLPPPADAGPELSRIILKACHPNPKKRYQKAAHLRKDLLLYQQGEYRFLSGWKKAAIGLAIGGGLLLACLAGIYAAGYSSISQVIHQITDRSPVRYKLDRLGVLRIWNTDKVPDITAWDLPKDSIRRLVLEEGIETIGQEAFYECRHLESVSFPSTLKTIEYDAFAHCTCLRLGENDLPDTIEMIEAGAFYDTAWEASQGQFPVIRGILTDYNPEVHEDTEEQNSDRQNSDGQNLDGQNSNGQNSDRQNSDGQISNGQISDGQNSNGQISNGQISDRRNSNGQISNGQILDGQNESSLRDLYLPEKVHTIGSYVFARDERIRSIHIPGSVTKIGDFALAGCSNLETITGMSGVDYIGYGAFDNTAWFKKQGDYIIVNDILVGYQGSESALTIPDTIHKIAEGAFEGNESIQSVIIPETVREVGDGAFVGCSRLSDVTCPSWMTEDDFETIFADTPWLDQ